MIRKSTKLVASIATGLMFVASGLVVNQASAAAKPVTITYFNFMSVPDHVADLNKQVAAFEKLNPGIKVNVTGSAYADYFTKLKTRIVGNQAPDVFDLNYENFVTYAGAGSLLNLNAVSKADKSFKKSDYYGKAYDVFSLDGKQFGLPASFSTTVLAYNADLFKSAGVAVPNSSWDWSDEAAANAQLKAKLPAGSFADFQPVQFWEFYKVLGQAGGTFLSADKKKALFNKQPGINALNWLIGKTANGYMPTKAQLGTGDESVLFKAGKLAMVHTGIWQFDAFKSVPFNWDIVVDPGGVHPGNHFFSNAMVVSAKTKQAAAAFKFAKFMTSDPVAVKIRIDAAWELPATSAKAPLATYLAKTPPANRAAVFEALKYPIVPPVIRQQSQLQDILNGWLEKAQNGSVSVSDALNSAAAEVNTLLANE